MYKHWSTECIKNKNEYEKPYTYDVDADSAFEDGPNQSDEEAEDLPLETGGSESESE